jgi:hypothetical protein
MVHLLVKVPPPGGEYYACTTSRTTLTHTLSGTTISPSSSARLGAPGKPGVSPFTDEPGTNHLRRPGVSLPKAFHAPRGYLAPPGKLVKLWSKSWDRDVHVHADVFVTTLVERGIPKLIDEEYSQPLLRHAFTILLHLTKYLRHIHSQ